MSGEMSSKLQDWGSSRLCMIWGVNRGGCWGWGIGVGVGAAVGGWVVVWLLWSDFPFDSLPDRICYTTTDLPLDPPFSSCFHPRSCTARCC